MRHTMWYKEAIIYQIYPRSFCDSNNDGIGDIKGIISKLDYLQELGVNAVWLSPIYDSPQEDNGYDISDYKKVYPPFGTLEDMKILIAEMHKRGIKLIMDLVVNHTSSEHQWFKEALLDPSSPYRDYYIIKKGRKNGKKPPNNWSGFFGEGAWERIPNSEDYYLHLFAKGQPDLNWENPKVREEVKDILRFWLEMGVDGFRCDVITLISKKQDFKNRFPTIALTGKDAYVMGPRIHEFLHELYEDVYTNYDAMTVGETVMSSLEEAKMLVDPKRQELDMIFNFDITDTDNIMGVKYLYRKFKLQRMKKVYRKWQKGLDEINGWNSLFLENHDQRRLPGRFNTNEKDLREVSMKMIASSYFLLKGTPFIYQGQEIGMTNAHFEKLEDYKDVEIHNIMNLRKHHPLVKMIVKEKVAYEVSRDNARTPMQWDDTEYAGFSKVEPWIKVNPNKEYINVKQSLESNDSIFHYYQDLINIKKNHPVIKDGEVIELFKNDNKVYAYERKNKDESIVVITSFSDKPIKRKALEEFKDNELLLCNYQEINDIISLRPYEARIYKK